VDQNYLIDLVSGLFGFKKEVDTPSSRPAVCLSDSSGLTGVARYLKSQEVVQVLSGVARYLKSQEEVAAVNEDAGSSENREIALLVEVGQELEKQQETVSSVTKYLDKLEQFPVSSVAKYMARQALIAKKAPKVSGVAKYMAKHAIGAIKHL